MIKKYRFSKISKKYHFFFQVKPIQAKSDKKSDQFFYPKSGGHRVPYLVFRNGRFEARRFPKKSARGGPKNDIFGSIDEKN